MAAGDLILHRLVIYRNEEYGDIVGMSCDPQHFNEWPHSRDKNDDR